MPFANEIRVNVIFYQVLKTWVLPLSKMQYVGMNEENEGVINSSNVYLLYGIDAARGKKWVILLS